MGFLGFVFVQLDYNPDPHSVQRRHQLGFHCSLILIHCNNNIYVIEIGITGNRRRISPFFFMSQENYEYVTNALCAVVKNTDLRTRSDCSAWCQEALSLSSKGLLKKKATKSQSLNLINVI